MPGEMMKGAQIQGQEAWILNPALPWIQCWSEIIQML